ncbi:MAG TPA: Crp/Fnr family transcriptional regulator, partial [Pyrinomonadaceae bacterium]|nr:Crp/Fnr family transcriptional regulator [Pyrinomonadaceae bacterium]
MLKTATEGNTLLASLSERDLSSLADSLRFVSLRQGDNVYLQGDRVEHLYFPLNCVLSTAAVMNDGATVEVSMTGREGVVGVSSAFGDYAARNWTRALIGGDAVRVSVEAVKDLCARSESAQVRVMGAYRQLITQVSQRAICNCRHTLMQRLCTWLLMVHDRAGTDDMSLTQEMMAGRLGARRAGVTQAARLLLLSGAVRYSRGEIHFNDRTLVEHMACECYRVHREIFRGTHNAGGTGVSFA